MNGKRYSIKPPLPAGADIWKGVTELVRHYKTDLNADTLFLKDFDKTLANQQYHIENCIEEIYVTGADGIRRHYYEREPGIFLLYRGTNRNESIHSRVNRIWPDKCSPELANSLLDAFRFNWNFCRASNAPEDLLGGVDLSVVRISNIEAVLILQSLISSSSKYTQSLIDGSTVSLHKTVSSRVPAEAQSNSQLRSNEFLQCIQSSRFWYA